MKIIMLHQTMGMIDRGSEISLDLIARELAKSHDVLVLQSGKETKKPYSVKRIDPRSSQNLLPPRSFLSKLAGRMYLDQASLSIRNFTKSSLSTIKKFNPDLIVATNGYPQLKELRGSGISARIVVFGRAGIGYHDRDSLRLAPDLFIALSHSAKDWADRLAPTSTKVVYIPNPLIQKKAHKIDLGLPSPVVMTVGALSSYKNIDTVIKAVRDLNVSFLLVGDGEEQDRISRELSMMANDFRWIRHLDPVELPSYYRSADLFCFIPDQQEAFGRVYLEAMVAGLPIVASDDEVRREIIGKSGIYVDPNDLRGVKSGLTLGLSKGKLDYSAKLKEYDLKTVVKQIEKEFHDLIK